MTQEKINKWAQEYKVNETKKALHLLREPDAFEMKIKLFSAEEIEAAFKAGAGLADKHSIKSVVRKEENLQGLIPWSERKPEEGAKGIVIIIDYPNGFHLASMGLLHPRKIEEIWGSRMQDMYWIDLSRFLKPKQSEKNNMKAKVNLSNENDKIRRLYKGEIIQEVSASDNYCLFKEKGPKNINWEQRRYELAKAAMQGLLNATSVERFTLRIKPSSIAEASLEYADELIKKLKKNNKKK